MKKKIHKKIIVVIALSVASTIIIAVVFTFALFVDMHNASSGVGSNLRFDWLTGGCTFLAAIASLFLGIVAIIQNIRANESNERLAKINDAQLESSIVSQNYPIIKFRGDQVIKLDTKTFELKFFDVRNIPLEKIFISNMQLYPYSGRYSLDKSVSPISVWKGRRWMQAEFTPEGSADSKKDASGFYLVDIEVDPSLFQKYPFYRIEFKIDIMSTAKVVTTYKRYCLLMERANSTVQSDTRSRPIMYHQFCEFGKTVSERVYKLPMSSEVSG